MQLPYLQIFSMNLFASMIFHNRNVKAPISKTALLYDVIQNIQLV